MSTQSAITEINAALEFLYEGDDRPAPRPDKARMHLYKARQALTSADVPVPPPRTEAAAQSPPTLPEIRHLLGELHYEIENRGGPRDSEGQIFHQAHETLRWLLDAYLRRGVFVEPN